MSISSAGSGRRVGPVARACAARLWNGCSGWSASCAHAHIPAPRRPRQHDRCTARSCIQMRFTRTTVCPASTPAAVDGAEQRAAGLCIGQHLFHHAPHSAQSRRAHRWAPLAEQALAGATLLLAEPLTPLLVRRPGAALHGRPARRACPPSDPQSVATCAALSGIESPPPTSLFAGSHLAEKFQHWVEGEVEPLMRRTAAALGPAFLGTTPGMFTDTMRVRMRGHSSCTSTRSSASSASWAVLRCDACTSMQAGRLTGK